MLRSIAIAVLFAGAFSSSVAQAQPANPIPTVTSINPASGLAGTKVVITGTGFTATSTVMFGSVAAPPVTFLNNIRLIAVAPAGNGTVDVRVTTAGQTSAISFADRFTYAGDPPVRRIIPNPGPAVEDKNQFAFDLYARLAQKPGNTFFSPFSITNALAMTYAGAQGQTAQEMAKTLHFTSQGDHAALGDVIRQLAKDQPFQLINLNCLWGQDGLKFRPEFLAVAQNFHRYNIQFADFKKDAESSRQKINQWVEMQTNKKVKDLLDKGTIDTGTRLVLTNAIYFKANWLSPFKKEATRPEDFTMPGTPAFKVPMMNQTLYPAYLANGEFQLVQLPYMGNEVSMVVILPRKMDGLAAVEKKLSAKSLAKNLIKANAAGIFPRVNLSLPKFKMTQQFQLKDELAAMGMGTAFSDRADFSGITESRTDALKIDQVIIKAFVEVDENGTEAAAASTVKMKDKAVPPAISFRADHPFLFVIRHNATGSILFMGRLNDPR